VEDKLHVYDFLFHANSTLALNELAGSQLRQNWSFIQVAMTGVYLEIAPWRPTYKADQNQMSKFTFVQWSEGSGVDTLF